MKGTILELLSAKLVILILISVMTLASSCRKGEEVTPDDNTSTADEVKVREYIPVDPSLTGTLVAVKYLDFDDAGLNVTGTSGRAWAKFPGLDESMSAGNVRVLGNLMNENTDHLYSYNAEGSTPGLSFSQGISSWDISGSLTVPSGNFIVPGGFPQITGIITLSDTISRAEDFSFGTGNTIVNADSVRFSIFSSSSYVYANKESGEQFHTFKPELLKYLSQGEGLIMMTAFRYITVSASGTNWAVLHQASTLKSVYIE